MNPIWLSTRLTDWLTNWLTDCATVSLSVCLSDIVAIALTTLGDDDDTSLQLCTAFGFRWCSAPEYATFLLAVCVLSGNVYEYLRQFLWILRHVVCVSGSGTGPRDTYTGTGRKDESTPKRRYYGNFTTWWCARLFGYLGKSSNLFAIVVDTDIHCNCVEIDMRCYFNRSFPSLPLYSHSHIHSPTTVPTPSHCNTRSPCRAAFAGEIWFMHISIWFISLASSNRTPKKNAERPSSAEFDYARHSLPTFTRQPTLLF